MRTQDLFLLWTFQFSQRQIYIKPKVSGKAKTPVVSPAL